MREKNAAKLKANKCKYLQGKKILPPPIRKNDSLSDVIDHSMLAYNGGRVRAACHLLKEKMLKGNVTVGITLTGALTPAGLGSSSLIPLIKAGFIDWIVTTGANVYHDLHFAFNMDLRQGSHLFSDAQLRKEGIVRIYDIVFDNDVLIKTDAIVRQMLCRQEFQKEMGTSEFYHLMGKLVHEEEKKRGLKDTSFLAACYRNDVPVFTSSPGDSTIGMDIASMELISKKFKLKINPSIDVNESTSIVYAAKAKGGRTGVIICGGGSPKNFMLQTEPQIQEVLMIPETGHDYFLQITDARPDTGGLSGATPSEAVSWGKVDPGGIDDTVIVYSDATIALPLITSYLLQNVDPRPLKRLYKKREENFEILTKAFFKHNTYLKEIRSALEEND
ncbi:MAG: deoxyhypusine synthase [bacterium]